MIVHSPMIAPTSVDTAPPQVRGAAARAGLAVSARGVRKSYTSDGKVIDALRSVDLQVARGEFVGLLGPNGAGKTTLIEILEGIRGPDSGEVRVLDADVRDEAAMKRMRAAMGISLQHSTLPPLMTVEEILRLQRRLYGSRVDPDRILDLVGLSNQRGRRNDALSGGQQQRVAIALALMGDPELMFLDEPTSQLDPHARLALWEVLYEQRARRNASVLITTHQMEEAQRICDRVVIIDRGQVIAEGRPSDLIREHFNERRIAFVTDKDVLIEVGAAGHRATALHDGRMRHEVTSTRPLDLLADLSRQFGEKIAEVSITEPSLEELFLKLTSEHAKETTL